MREMEVSKQRKEEVISLHKQIAYILVRAKEMGKWVPLQYLVKYGIKALNLQTLEDKDLLIIKDNTCNGRAIKLTLRGYHAFSQYLRR